MITLQQIQEINKKRWYRLKYWRKNITLPLKMRHKMMNTEIKLIREGKVVEQEILQKINN